LREGTEVREEEREYDDGNSYSEKVEDKDKES